jgi:hypothetical protein
MEPLQQMTSDDDVLLPRAWQIRNWWPSGMFLYSLLLLTTMVTSILR